MKINNLQELNDAFEELFDLEDPCLLPLLTAVFVNAKTSLRHVWLYLIGESSGGKTTALGIFSKVTFIEGISDFTENTLLSGARSNNGHETSLLRRLGSNFAVVMKDFTTILSKSEDQQNRLMSQLREVYDGYMRKETGLGVTIEWGKKDRPLRSVFVMASTEAIFKIQERFSEMGSRGLSYVLPKRDKRSRCRMTKKSLKKAEGIEQAYSQLQTDVAEYVHNICRNLPERFPDLPDDIENIIIETAELVTRARSVVLRDYRGVKSLALSSEAPTRVATQLQAIAQILIYLNDGKIDDWIIRTVKKCAFDCIPKQSHLVLKHLSVYNQVNVEAIANIINYSSDRTLEWLENLQMHNVVEHHRIGDRWYWRLSEDDRKLLIDYFGLERKYEDLNSSPDDYIKDEFGDYVEELSQSPSPSSTGNDVI